MSGPCPKCNRVACLRGVFCEPAPAQPNKGEQPAPIPNNGEDCWAEALRLMQARRQLGIQRYGTILQPGNGRDAVRDWLDEDLDRIAYAVQVLKEWDALREENRQLRYHLGQLLDMPTACTSPIDVEENYERREEARSALSAQS